MYYYLLDTPIPEYELETIRLFHNQQFFKNGYIWESKNQHYTFKDLKNFPKKTFLLNSFYLECYNLTLVQFGWPNCQNYFWTKIDIYWLPGKLPIHFLPGCTIRGSFCEIVSSKRQTTHFFVQRIEFVKKSRLK